MKKIIKTFLFSNYQVTTPELSESSVTGSTGKFTTSDGFKFKIVNWKNQEVKKGETGTVMVLSPLKMINYLHEKGQKSVEWVINFEIYVNDIILDC